MQDEEQRRAVGARLKACRVSMGLSQADVGEALGRTAQAVSKWERGASLPKSEEWPGIALLFGTSLDYLFLGIRTVPVASQPTLARIFSAPGAAGGTHAHQPAS